MRSSLSFASNPMVVRKKKQDRWNNNDDFFSLLQKLRIIILFLSSSGSYLCTEVEISSNPLIFHHLHFFPVTCSSPTLFSPPPLSLHLLDSHHPSHPSPESPFFSPDCLVSSSFSSSKALLRHHITYYCSRFLRPNLISQPTTSWWILINWTN